MTVIDHRGIVHDNAISMANSYKVDYNTFLNRTRNGWSLKKALETPDSTFGEKGERMKAKAPDKIQLKVSEMMNAAMRNEEWHGNVWESAPWTIALERHPYGTIRMWITREDKQGHYQCSLCTVYRINGQIEYSCDFPLAKHVVEKVHSICRILEKNGLVQ